MINTVAQGAQPVSLGGWVAQIRVILLEICFIAMFLLMRNKQSFDFLLTSPFSVHLQHVFVNVML